MKKILVNILLLIMCVSSLSACTSESKTIEEVTNDTVVSDTNNTNKVSDNNTSSDNKNTSDTTSDNNDIDLYKSSYISYITSLNENDENASGYKYSLIYVDDNEVPELFINTNVDALGTKIVTIYNGVINEIELSSVIEYIEKTGLIRTYGGTMDNYTMNIYKLENGGFDTIATANIYLSEDDLKAAKEGETFNWTYTWQGNVTSEEEYNANMNAIFEIGSGITPIGEYTSEDIISLLD